MRIARLFMGLMLLAISAFAGDVTGKWTASVQGPDGDMQITFDLKEDGHKLTGTSTSHMGQLPITDGTVDGDNVAFTVANDQFTAVHKGTVKGDEMKLTVDVNGQSFNITAKRAASEPSK